jgi:hypothetical protein
MQLNQKRCCWWFTDFYKIYPFFKFSYIQYCFVLGITWHLSLPGTLYRGFPPPYIGIRPIFVFSALYVNTLMQNKFFNTWAPSCLYHGRGMILITASMVSVYCIYIYFKLPEHPLYQAPVDATPPKSMVKSEASQVDEGYFILALSLHTCLQHLPHAIAQLTRSIHYLGLIPQYVNGLCSPAA